MTIGELPAFTKLDVRNTNLTKDACAALSRGLVGLKNLTYLDLSNNPLEELAGSVKPSLRKIVYDVNKHPSNRSCL